MKLTVIISIFLVSQIVTTNASFGFFKGASKTLAANIKSGVQQSILSGQSIGDAIRNVTAIAIDKLIGGTPNNGTSSSNSTNGTTSDNSTDAGNSTDSATNTTTTTTVSPDGDNSTDTTTTSSNSTNN